MARPLAQPRVAVRRWEALRLEDQSFFAVERTEDLADNRIRRITILVTA